MDNLGYLFAAYTVIWVVLFGLMLSFHNRQRQLRRDIESLKREFEDKRKGS